MSHRSRVALVIATMSLSASLLLTAQQQPVSDVVVNPLAGNAEAIRAGAANFLKHCADCHGSNAVGDVRGPALNTGRFKNGSEDADLFRIIRNGVPRTEMEAYPEFSDTERWQLVAYLRSLSGQPGPGGPAAGAAAAANAGNPTAGEALFFGKAECSTCHDINGRGGAVGPDLSAAARLAPAAVRQKILDPNTPLPAGRGGAPGRAGGPGAGPGRGGPPAPSTVVVKDRAGKEIRGVRRTEDTFSLQMVDATGKVHLIDKLAVAEVRVETTSLMPAYANRLTPAEVNDLVAYLATRQSRDPVSGATTKVAAGISYERLVKATSEPQNWPMYWGNYQGTHSSGLTQITPANAHQLQAVWATPIPGDSILQNTPIVVDGIMYVTGSGNPLTVTALDARTGRQIWRYTRQQATRNPLEINRFNRGVAILDHRLFVGTLDAVLIALDARSGAVLWQVTMADTMEGYELTSPPLVIKDKVITGIAGGEYGTRGFVDAYDSATGKRLWRFYTVPGPGEFGHETWLGDSWQKGGSGAWLTPTYDPELNLIYVPVGNPAPQVDRKVRGDGLDNLFSNSVVALDANTGQRKWHYQFTPNDGHDWDSTEDMVLVDRMWKGRMRKLLLHADRNSFFYVLDRETGEFLQATNFVYQTWNAGFDAKGRPIAVPNSNSSDAGSIFVYPTLGGGTNFQAPSYSATTGLFYLEYAESGAQFTSGTAVYEKGSQYIGRSAAPPANPATRGPQDPPSSSGIKALDPATGKTVWDFKTFQGSLNNGLLSTAGQVVLASIRDGNIVALDARDGRHLWHFQTGAANAASPMSYAVDGRQFVAMSAGNFVYAFALPQAPKR